MIRALVIAPDRELREGLLRPERSEERAALQSVVIQQTLDYYPDEADLRSILDLVLPQVVFYDAATSLEAVLDATRILRERTGVLLVALHRACEPQVLIRLMQAGVREIWHLPYEASPVQQSLERLNEALREQPGAAANARQVIAFLPAKPGSGASTIAVNTALALARLEKRRVLLADLDLQEGIAKFLLKLSPAFTAVDALEKITELDDTLWAEVVAKADLIDVLISGPVAGQIPYSVGRLRR